LIPVALMALAPALTVPWTFWVIEATFDRDVIYSANSLARRVEERVKTIPNLNEANAALNTELASDEAVRQAIFVDLTQLPLRGVWSPQTTKPRMWTVPQIQDLIAKGVTQSTYKDHYIFTIPWFLNGRAVGFTYLDLSREKLRQEFWQREGSLVRHVVAFSAGAMLVLAVVGFLAMRWYQKMGRVREQAELTQQGLLAERGLTAAVLAHEIRNPLAALRFQLHSLRKNAAEPPRVAATADTIDQELSRIQTLVTDYLEHEKARTMRVSAVDLAEAARGLRTLMDVMLRQTSTELNVVGPEDGAVVVACDPHALRQILMNLVLNAQQAITGAGRQGLIVLRIGHEGQFGTLDITDNGPGIADDIRQRLFKPFQTSKAEGHGIGLALVKRFADNFGGSVGVDSELGRGTTFHLKLPLAQEMDLSLEAGSNGS
jgi:signal transduction histidine kinase